MNQVSSGRLVEIINTLNGIQAVLKQHLDKIVTAADEIFGQKEHFATHLLSALVCLAVPGVQIVRTARRDVSTIVSGPNFSFLFPLQTPPIQANFSMKHQLPVISWGRNPVCLYLSCVLRKKTYKEYNGMLILGNTYVSISLPFCAAGDFFCGAFKLQKLYQCALFCRCILFFYGFLIIYNFFH